MKVEKKGRRYDLDAMVKLNERERDGEGERQRGRSPILSGFGHWAARSRVI